MKSFILKIVANFIAKDIQRWSAEAVDCQEKIFLSLIEKAKNTAFGKDHDFKNIKSYKDFQAKVPLRDYEGLKAYIERIKKGEKDVLWVGKPAYFAKTSGTTSGVKYIPISKESIPNHINTARNALFNRIVQVGNADFLTKGKVIFLSGSPEMDKVGGIFTGRLSGIVNHHVPAWLRTNQMPSYETNCIEDWETKLDKIVEETLTQDMRLISGIPPWVQMYYERILEKTGKKTIKEVFPNYTLFAYGGVNFEPYRSKLEELTGGKIAGLETYPASEGFIAFQDQIENIGLLLNANSGIFFEFVPAEEIFKENPTRLSLREVKLGVNYALIINNNAGLWGYNIGDTVEFVSLNPYRIKVTGRIKHFISAFGEHVIGKEVEEAMLQATKQFEVKTVEYTVAPQVNAPDGGQPYHEWLVEFDVSPTDLLAFAAFLDETMQKQNIYYEDLRAGNILRTLVVTSLKRDAFRDYMKSQGKLGGQNKVPRLSNDRNIADLI